MSVVYDKSMNDEIKSYYFIGAQKEGLIQITSFKEYDDWHQFGIDAVSFELVESQGIPDFTKLNSTLKVGNDLTIQ